MAFPFINPVATITNGTSLSGAIAFSGRAFAGLLMPAAWTAATLTFQGSVDGTNFYDLYDTGGNEVTFTVAASHFVAGDPSSFVGLSHIKLRSGTGGAAVNQAADRLITVALRQIPNLK